MSTNRLSRLPSLAGVHVLLAEDDARFASTLAAMLEWRGATVAIARPETALRILRTIIPTVLVVGASPVSAAVLLTASRRASVHINETLVPALLIADSSRTLASESWRAAGFRACLTKPIEMAELCRAVNYLATERRRIPPTKLRETAPTQPARLWKSWLLP